jgi:hypothetical protein
LAISTCSFGGPDEPGERTAGTPKVAGLAFAVPTHEIEMNQTTRMIGKIDVVFVVSSDVEGKLGELRLSRGGVDWWPRSSKTRFYQCSWERLRDFLEDQQGRSAV